MCCYTLLDTSELDRIAIYYVPAHSTGNPDIGTGGDDIWERKINRFSSDSTLNIWLCDCSVVIIDSSQNEVPKQRKYKKLKYKIRDLDSIKWKIVIND